MLRAFFQILLGAALCGLLVQTGYAEDDAPGDIEINPSEYVPLAVGNSWTYEHSYWNDRWGYFEGLGETPFDIPGYPNPNGGNSMPPDSLTLVERILTIEITHTEMIDGLEYFVFSDPDYVWPPLPDLFWGGKKVRLSDEEFLVFRWNGQDLPFYALDHHFDEHRSLRYTVSLPRLDESDTAKVNITRSMFFYSDQVIVKFDYSFAPYYGEVSGCFFLRGYGIGQVFTWLPYLEGTYIFHNLLTPISANIDRKEILYPEHTLVETLPNLSGPFDGLFDLLDNPFPSIPPDTTTSIHPTSWGQLKQLVPRRRIPSHDFPSKQGD